MKFKAKKSKPGNGSIAETSGKIGGSQKMKKIKKLEKTNQKLIKLAKQQQQEEELSNSGENMDEIANIKSILAEEEPNIYDFLSSNNEKEETINLAELILSKINEEALKQNNNSTTIDTKEEKVSPSVSKSYTEVGEYLRYYKSGKLPKAVKIIPRLQNWEMILAITQPQYWTPNAMFAVTCIFASNFTSYKVENFYNWILLPTIREDIATSKKLNYHYYMALKKAIYKPIAWLKSILFPLVETGCTLREAIIVGSILSKVSLPMQYGAAALSHLCQISQWYATTSHFITILIQKKYSLPEQVIEAVANHLYGFMNDSRVLPVMWQKSFLAFAQRYKLHLNMEQKSKLFDVLKKHHHPTIGPLIETELTYVDPAAVLLTEGSN